MFDEDILLRRRRLLDLTEAVGGVEALAQAVQTSKQSIDPARRNFSFPPRWLGPIIALARERGGFVIDLDLFHGPRGVDWPALRLHPDALGPLR